MATINYNGMELEEVTTPQIFDPPKLMLVWDSDRPAFTNDIPNLNKRKVIAILPKVFANDIVLTINHENKYIPYTHCAEIPDPPKPRRATWLEVARWCATGNGLVYDTDRDKIDTGIMFKPSNESEPIMESIKVRKWSDTEWHEPTVDYLGIDDKDCNFNKKYGEV